MGNVLTHDKTMNTVAYTALTDISAYMAPEHPFAEQNADILRQLTVDSTYCGLYEPLDFLNLLHAQFVLVRANRLDDGVVLEHLRSLEMGFLQRKYLYYCLGNLISEYIKTSPKDCSRGMSDCKYTIDAERRRISTAIYQPEKYKLEMERKYFFEGKQKILKLYDPTKDLDAYMDNLLNLEIHQTITEGDDWETEFQPLAFFQLLYKQFEIACDNSDRPLAFKSHLFGLELDDDHRYVLLYFLVILLKEHPNLVKSGKEGSSLNILYELLERKCRRLETLRRNTDKTVIEDKGNSELPLDGGLEHPKNVFLLYSKNGAKTDLVRLLNAIYHLKLILTKDGMLPTKDEFMRSFGQFLGTDLEGYSTMLSRAVNSTGLEANMKVFNELSGYMETLFDKGLEDPKRQR